MHGPHKDKNVLPKHNCRGLRIPERPAATKPLQLHIMTKHNLHTNNSCKSFTLNRRQATPPPPLTAHEKIRSERGGRESRRLEGVLLAKALGRKCWGTRTWTGEQVGEVWGFRGPNAPVGDHAYGGIGKLWSITLTVGCRPHP